MEETEDSCTCLRNISINKSTVLQPNHNPHPSSFRLNCLLHMNSFPSSSSHSPTDSKDGCLNHTNPLSPSTHSTQLGKLPMLDGIRPDNYSKSNPASHTLYANALKFGMGGGGHPQIAPPEPALCPELSGSDPAGCLPVMPTPLTTDPSDTQHEENQNPNPSHLDELLTCCLLGKIWGDPVPLPAIIQKTKKDWVFVKGHIDYIDAGNYWILLRFANAKDRYLVYDQRPWHVNGFNFVIQNWTPFFDPYSTEITSIDQWVRVPRLPWEFWDQASLSTLLHQVGPVIRVDQNTLLRLKGKFARVCVHIDITRPLPGSLTITRQDRSMRVPLIYEGLHEVCPLCGGESHQLESCPKLPSQKKIQVVVQRFDESSAKSTTTEPPPSDQNIPQLSENWVTVSPKKRMRSTSITKHKTHFQRSTQEKESIVPAQPPTVVDPNKLCPENQKQTTPPNETPNPSPAKGKDTKTQDVAYPPTYLLTEEEEKNDEEMEDDTNDDIFFNLENIEDVEMSTDSSKRKRIEEGEECNSHS